MLWTKFLIALSCLVSIGAEVTLDTSTAFVRAQPSNVAAIAFDSDSDPSTNADDGTHPIFSASPATHAAVPPVIESPRLIIPVVTAYQATHLELYPEPLLSHHQRPPILTAT